MTMDRPDLTRGIPFPATWVRSLMEYVSTLENFALTPVGTTQVQIVAGTDNAQAAIGINGKWRYNTATVTATHPGGAAGTYDAYVTAYANDLTAIDPLDNTIYSFGLTIRARVSGSPDPPPTGTAASALSKRIAVVTWNGTKITAIQRLAGKGDTALVANAWLPFPTGGVWSLGGTLQDPQYRLTADGRYVELKGVLESTGTQWSTGSTMPTMPSGYRPVNTVGFIIPALEVSTTNRWAGALTIDSSGILSIKSANGGTPTGGNTMRAFLDGVRYPLD